MKKLPRLKKLFINLTVSVFALVLFFGLAEILTRIFWHHHGRQGNIGIILEGPNRRAVIGGIEYRLNSLELRMNEDIDPEKPKGIKRILALGDSFLFGDGLPYEELVTGKIEKALNTDTRKVKVINGAHSDSDTNDEFIQFQRLAPICHPDLVIVFFFTNDVVQHSLGPGKTSWQQRTKEYLITKSEFCAFLYSVYKDKLSSKIGVPKAFLPSEYFNLDDSKPGWVEFKKATLQIKEFCNRLEAKLLFVLIPTLTNLDKRYPYAELREKTTKHLNDCNIPTIDLFDLFAPYKPSELWVSQENTHWNRMATTLAANEIANKILKNRLLELSDLPPLKVLPVK